MAFLFVTDFRTCLALIIFVPICSSILYRTFKTLNFYSWDKPISHGLFLYMETEEYYVVVCDDMTIYYRSG